MKIASLFDKVWEFFFQISYFEEFSYVSTKIQMYNNRVSVILDLHILGIKKRWLGLIWANGYMCLCFFSWHYLDRNLEQLNLKFE